MKYSKNISKIKLLIVKTIIFLGQKTFIGRGQIRRKIVDFINYYIDHGQIKESRFICKVNGVPFNFYNDKLTGIKIYFGRNENKEINFIKKNCHNNSVFVDIGSNMGLYTQNIAFMINEKKKIKIISIDANPINIFRLRENLKLLRYKIPNIFSFVKIKNCAVGNRNTKLKLNFSNGLANGFISKDKKGTSVNCRKLIDIVNQEKLNFITSLKIDIEGFEDKVLITYLKNCKKKLFPKNIILEHSSKELWNDDLIKFLFENGYKNIFENKSNLILSLKK